MYQHSVSVGSGRHSRILVSVGSGDRFRFLRCFYVSFAGMYLAYYARYWGNCYKVSCSSLCVARSGSVLNPREISSSKIVETHRICSEAECVLQVWCPVPCVHCRIVEVTAEVRRMGYRVVLISSGAGTSQSRVIEPFLPGLLRIY